MNIGRESDGYITTICRVLRVLLISLAVVGFVGSAYTPVEAGWLKKAKKAAKKAGKDINKEVNRAVDNVSHEANKVAGDVKREVNRFQTDVNRELTKFENDYSREVRKFGNDIARETRGAIADAQDQSQRGISFGSFKLGENLAGGMQQLGRNLTQGERNLTYNIDRGVGTLGNNLMHDPYWKEGAPFLQRLINVPVAAAFKFGIYIPVGLSAGGADRLGRNIGDAWRQVGGAVSDEGHRAQERIFGSPKVTDLDKSETGTVKTSTSREPYPAEAAGSAMTTVGSQTSRSSSMGSMESSGSSLGPSSVGMKKDQTTSSTSSTSTSRSKPSSLPKKK